MNCEICQHSEGNHSELVCGYKWFPDGAIEWCKCRKFHPKGQAASGLQELKALLEAWQHD